MTPIKRTRSLNMSKQIKFDRRRLLHAAAAGVAAGLIPAGVAAAHAGGAKSAGIVAAGTNTSFGHEAD